MKKSLVFIHLWLLLSFSKTIDAQINQVDSFKLELSKTSKDTTALQLLEKISTAYFYDESLDSSMKYALAGLELAKELQRPKNQSSFINRIGGIYIKQAKYNEAFNQLYNSLRISEPNAYFDEIIESYNSIGAAYGFMGEYNKAIVNYKKSLAFCQKMNAQNKIIRANNNIGSTYYSMNLYDSAIVHLESAMKMAKSMNNENMVSIIRLNIGNVYVDKKDYTNAEKIYKDCVANFKTNNDKKGMVIAIFNLGKMYLAWNKLNDAESYFEQALILSKEINDTYEQVDTYLNLSLVFERKGSYSKALKYYKLYANLNDSLIKETDTKAIAEITAQYETSKKDNEILKLNKKNAEETKKRKTLLIYGLILFAFAVILFVFTYNISRHKQKVKLNQLEKEKIQSELNALKSQLNPHTFFNSLNTIYFQIDEDAEASKETILKYANLLRYQLYDSNVPFIEMDKEINYLKKYLEIQRLRISDRCHISFSIEGDFRNVQIAPLLLLSLVENACKFVSNDRDGDNFIRIILRKKETGFLFSIDNTFAVGIEEPETNKSGGIGLNNLVKRLNLIYPNRHMLSIDKKENIFSVNLTIYA